MRFRVALPPTTPSVAVRRCGYVPWTEAGEEQSFIRRLRSGPYPRFHLYVRAGSDGLECNLHLDQKRPSYGGGSHAHAGEYDGPLIEAEAQRIRDLLA